MSLYPRGVIPSVEAQDSHLQFVEAADPEYVLVKIDKARQIVKRGETADSYFPDGTKAIVTTTIMDEKLEVLPLRHNGYKRGELDIIREFQPEFYIPADHADYYNMNDEARMERVKAACAATIEMCERLADDPVHIIPLLKGSRPVERELFYNTCDQLGKDYVAFYSREYFGRAGGGLPRLKHDLGLVTDETKFSILLIGTCSPYVFERVPDSVVAGAGFHQWFDRVDLDSDSRAAMRDAYESLREEGDAALGLPDVDEDEDTPVSEVADAEAETNS